MNASSSELQGTSGDISNYWDWYNLNSVADSTLKFHLVGDSAARRMDGLGRRILQKTISKRITEGARRQMLLNSKLTWMPRDTESADVILSHLWFPRTRGSVPVVWNSQGISPEIYYERTRGSQWSIDDVVWLYSKLGARADALAIFTESCAQSVRDRLPDLSHKIHVVPAPLSGPTALSEKPSIRDGTIRFLFVGKSNRLKGLTELLAAFSLLGANFKDVELHVVTAASRTPSFLDRVTFHGLVGRGKLMNLLRDTDVFVLPTHADSYALTAIEAMAYGCAVVISELEPLQEVVPPGIAGLPVGVGDVEALSDVLCRLMASEKLLRSLQAGARALYLERHQPKKVASLLENLFLRISPSRGRSD